MSSAASSTTLDQSTSAGVSTSIAQDTTGITTVPGTTVVSSTSQALTTSPSSTAVSTTQSTSASSTAPTSTSASSSSVSSQTPTSTSQSVTSTTVVTVPPSTSTDPSSTSVVPTEPTSSAVTSSSPTSAAAEFTSFTSSSISVASSTGAGGTILRTTVVYTYVSSTRTGTSTNRATGLAGKSGSGSGGGSNTGAIVGGVVGGLGGLALLAAAAFFLLKRRKKARATVLDEKMFDPGYGRSNSIDLLGGAGNGMGASPVEASHISPFTGGHNSSSAYAEAAAAAGLGAGAAGAYALHDRGNYGPSAGDGYDNMTTTGGGSSIDDHGSYTHGMQPVNHYAGYPSNAAYPSPAFNRTDYPPDLPNESMRSPRWSGGWGVAAMGGVGADGQPGGYYSQNYTGGPQGYPSSAPMHAQGPSDTGMIAGALAPTAAEAKRREAQSERVNPSYGAAGPSGVPTSPTAGRTSFSSMSRHGDGQGEGEPRRASQGPDALGRPTSDMASSPTEEYQRPDVMVHTDGGSLLDSAPAGQDVELPPTYTSIRPEDQQK